MRTPWGRPMLSNVNALHENRKIITINRNKMKKREREARE